MKINRRNILQFGASGALASILGPSLMRKAAAAAEQSDEPMPRRQLGKTGEMISVIGFGGVHQIPLFEVQARRPANRPRRQEIHDGQGGHGFAAA